jgi:hypothetical protein
MASGEGMPDDPETLTDDQAARMLAEINEIIRAGDEMRQLRAEMVRLFVGFGWTQHRIAQLTDMSQPAVSKQMTKYKLTDPLPPPSLSLDQRDAPWLEGRLWALAEQIADTVDGARCAPFVHAVARGRQRFTPQHVDELRRLVEHDLRQHQATMPRDYRHTYDQLSRGLDIPVKVTTTESAGVRRALARQLQRDRFRDDH